MYTITPTTIPRIISKQLSGNIDDSLLFKWKPEKYGNMFSKRVSKNSNNDEDLGGLIR